MKRTTLVIGTMAALGLMAQVLHAQQRPGGQGGNPLIRTFDTDGDGVLSAAEIDAAAAKLRALDTSKDGKLTADELPRPAAGGRGPGGGSRGGGLAAAAGAAPDLQQPLIPRDDDEKRAMAALEEARRGQRYANVSTADGRLMRQLAESLGARRIVELGTSTGESGIWFGLALRKTGGHLYTHDIDPDRIKVARTNFQRAGVDDLITIIEGDAHETVKQHKEPIDLLFIDADKEGYADYLAKLLPLVRPGGLILAHNMHRPPVHPSYLKAITTNPDLDTSFVLMDGAGIGITLKKR